MVKTGWNSLEPIVTKTVVKRTIKQIQKYNWILRTGRGAEYCGQPICLSVVCLSTSISMAPLDRSAQNFVCRSPVAVARSFSGDIALHYVLPVLWMMSCLAVMGRMALCVRPEQLLAISYVRDRGGVWCLWMFVIYCDSSVLPHRRWMSWKRWDSRCHGKRHRWLGDIYQTVTELAVHRRRGGKEPEFAEVLQSQLQRCIHDIKVIRSARHYILSHH